MLMHFMLLLLTVCLSLFLFFLTDLNACLSLFFIRSLMSMCFIWAATKSTKHTTLDGAKIEKVLAELTMPAHASVIGKEAKRITQDFETNVLKEVQRYEHRIFQEMDPETAEQLQQSENEVSCVVVVDFIFAKIKCGGAK